MARARVPGMNRPGLVLPDGSPVPGAPISYPVIVETILHACGVNVVPMSGGAVMCRFPSTNGFTVSVPLTSEGVAQLIKQLEAATSQQDDPDATVSE